jgi:hypothetical protein
VPWTVPPYSNRRDTISGVAIIVLRMTKTLTGGATIGPVRAYSLRWGFCLGVMVRCYYGKIFKNASGWRTRNG